LEAEAAALAVNLDVCEMDERDLVEELMNAPPAARGALRMKLAQVSQQKQQVQNADQASRITLPAPCRFDNSPGDNFVHHFWLAGIAKCLAGSVKSFARLLTKAISSKMIAVGVLIIFLLNLSPSLRVGF
jgi:hypothetical protein